MNAHLERFNRTIQDEFIDYNIDDLIDINEFNNKLIDWLLFYNTERVHYAFQNKLSPVQYMINISQKSLPIKISEIMFQESKIGWPHTLVNKMFFDKTKS